MSKEKSVALAYYYGRSTQQGWWNIANDFPAQFRTLARDWYFRGVDDYMREMEELFAYEVR